MSQPQTPGPGDDEGSLRARGPARTTGPAQAVGPVHESVGYVLKQAAVALHHAMDLELRPLGLTVSQYACLELLGQRTGMSSADLARAMFVTRQSMSGVLRGLQERGLVTRPATAERGRELPTTLTQAGRDQLVPASIAVHGVEERMSAGMPPAQQRALLDALAACVRNLVPAP